MLELKKQYQELKIEFIYYDLDVLAASDGPDMYFNNVWADDGWSGGIS